MQALIISIGYTPLLHIYLSKVAPFIKLRSASKKKSSIRINTTLKAMVHSLMIIPLGQSLYWYSQGYFKNNQSHAAGYENFRSKIVKGDALWVTLMFWVPVSLGLYTVVPRRLGKQTLGSCGLVWAIILSYLGTQ